MGSGALTSSRSVKADDTEVEVANEQMMGSGGGGGGGDRWGSCGRGGREGLGVDSVGGKGLKAKREGESFSHCQMDEQLASLITAGTDFLSSKRLTHTHSHTHANT